MNKALVSIILFLLAGLFASDGDYLKKSNEITSDSLKISSVLDSVRSRYAGDELRSLLEKLSSSKKIFRPFGVDVYKRNKFKYEFDYRTDMTISEILDSLSNVIANAKILRINKLDIDNGNGKKISLADNSFKDLEKEPAYRSKDKIRELIENTALTSNQKSSLEWIWGKSHDNDAYFSSKLTFFDDHFSLYPDYRFYIGSDPFRDPKSWFFTLENYPPVTVVPVTAEIKTEPLVKEEKKQETVKQETVKKEPEKKPEIIVKSEEKKEIIAEVIKSEKKADQKINSEVKKEKISEPVKPIKQEEPEFDCGSARIEAADFSLDAVFYEKNDKGESIPVNRTLNVSELIKAVFQNKEKIKIIRLTGTDFMFSNGEISKNDTESVIEITGDIGVCTEKLKAFIAEGLTEPNKKRSVELITGANKDKLSYNTSVITVYDGQTTIFTDYKVYASSEVRKDKKSWFNKL
ncbi:MAG TPA: hypothetical protein PLK90_08455 [Clostridiales bacterium]|nr:hypothetical protein [Clostridiales bacterium]HQP70413.1 hypothetical protein [Clostridiales bacterium]